MRTTARRQRRARPRLAARATLLAAAVLGGAAALACGVIGSGDPTPTATVTQTATATATATAVPTPTPALPPEVIAGQLIMGAFTGTTAEGAASLVRDYHVGNVTILTANAGSPADVAALTDGLQAMAVEANGAMMLISADQEGGRVIRLGAPFAQLPPARIFGCIGEAEFARQAGLVTGTELMAAGINMNLAPVADVLTNPANTVIGDRAFAADAATVGRMTSAYVDGLHQAGALATVKHFPGHGMTSGDSHDGSVTIDEPLAGLEAVHIAPFRAVAATADVIMTSNVDYLALDPAGVPASLSAPVMRYLREELGFEGLIITDALGMGAVSNRLGAGEAAVRAIEAGADMVLFAGEAGAAEAAVALTDAIRTGRLEPARVAEAYDRVRALKGRIAHVARPPLDVVGGADHAAFLDLLYEAAAARGC